jgi:hypothetical protein
MAEAARLRIQFACEATLNIAKQPEILELMRQAAFVTVFVGIETPELEALKSIAKEQNAAVPILEGIRTLNSYGLEVTSGIIFGLDSETAESERRLIEFVEASQVPILTMNLLQALPRTPLWTGSSKPDGFSMIQISNRMCASCARTTKFWRAGGARSPIATRRSACLRAIGIRSRRRMRTASAHRRARSSPGATSGAG